MAAQQVIDFARAALARGRLFVVDFWVDERGEFNLGEAAGAGDPAGQAAGRAVGQAPRKVAQVALWTARRVDMFAPPAGAGTRGRLGEESSQRLRAETGVTVDPTTDMVAHTSIISYPSGHAEGPITFVLPAIAGRLGPWEQLVYYGVCAFYAAGRVVQTRDGRWVETSVYELSQMLVGRDDARTLERVRQAIQTLSMTIIAPRSEILVPAQDRGPNITPNSTKGTKRAGGKANRQPRMERVQVRSIFPLLAEAHFEELGIGDAERRSARGRIWLRLPTVVMQEIDARVVAYLPLDVLRKLGPRHEAALRVYTFALSQRRQEGKVEISSTVLHQIVRPTGETAKKPSHFRRMVKRIANEIEAATDRSVHCAIVPAGERAGGWKLTIIFRQS